VLGCQKWAGSERPMVIEPKLRETALSFARRSSVSLNHDTKRVPALPRCTVTRGEKVPTFVRKTSATMRSKDREYNLE